MKKLVSIVTICALVVTIGAFSVFADNLPQGGRLQGRFNSTNNLCSIFYNISYTDPYIFDVERNTTVVNNPSGSVAVNSASDTVYAQDYQVSLLFRSYSSEVVYIVADYLGIQINLANYSSSSPFNSYYDGFSIKDVASDQYSPAIYNVSSSVNQINIDFGNDFRGSNTNYIVLYPYCQLLVNFTYTRYNFNHSSSNAEAAITQNLSYFNRSPSSMSLIYPALSNGVFSASTSDNIEPYNQIYNTYHINKNVQSILDQYTANSQNAQAVTNGTQTNEQTLSNIATNEDTWFSQNDQALTATGMDNFTYTPQVMSGLTVISDQFNQLWIAIGDWNFVYTFSMMIGLVVLILRHNPQRKKSSSGGKSNATGS